MRPEAISVSAFNHWRLDRTAAMTLVDLCHGGALYYYDSPYGCAVWVFAGAEALLVSYHLEGGPQRVRAQVKRLLDALPADPAALEGIVLAALCKPGDEAVRVACFRPGDWCGLSKLDLPPRWDQLPPGWPESERARIEQLIDERVRRAQASTVPEEIYPVGQALARLKMVAQAEAVFRRLLAVQVSGASGSRSR